MHYIEHMEFRFDPAKAATNLSKHKVGFELAEAVFTDQGAVFYEDSVIDGEQRWHAIGMVQGTLLLLVVHTVENEEDEVYRLISIRKADSYEERIYADGY